MTYSWKPLNSGNQSIIYFSRVIIGLMTHGAHRQLYNVVQPHHPWRGWAVVQHCTTPSPMEGVSRCTTLYNPITHGEGGSLYNVVQPHDPWGPCIVVQPHDSWGFVPVVQCCMAPWPMGFCHHCSAHDPWGKSSWTLWCYYKYRGIKRLWRRIIEQTDGKHRTIKQT